jgi:hypothetical protein
VRTGSGNECCGQRGLYNQDLYPFYKDGGQQQFCLAPGVLTKKVGA